MTDTPEARPEAQPTSGSIPLPPGTARFYQGAAAGDRVTKEHAAVEFPSFDARQICFWFFVGALAGGEYGCKSADDFTPFMEGATTRAPARPKEATLEELERRITEALLDEDGDIDGWRLDTTEYENGWFFDHNVAVRTRGRWAPERVDLSDLNDQGVFADLGTWLPVGERSTHEHEIGAAERREILTGVTG